MVSNQSDVASARRGGAKRRVSGYSSRLAAKTVYKNIWTCCCRPEHLELTAATRPADGLKFVKRLKQSDESFVAAAETKTTLFFLRRFKIHQNIWSLEHLEPQSRHINLFLNQSFRLLSVSNSEPTLTDLLSSHSF